LIFKAKFHSLYAKESESGVGVGNFGKVRVGVGVGYFYLRLRNPAGEFGTMRHATSINLNGLRV